MRKPKLKFYNGRLTDWDHGYIAAYSQAQAVEMAAACSLRGLTTGELRGYWSDCWGNIAEQTLGTPTEPCIWAIPRHHGGTIVRLYPTPRIQLSTLEKDTISPPWSVLEAMIEATRGVCDSRLSAYQKELRSRGL